MERQQNKDWEKKWNKPRNALVQSVHGMGKFQEDGDANESYRRKHQRIKEVWLEELAEKII
jgi:stalled ribosome alternative rescue factor ArfA